MMTRQEEGTALSIPTHSEPTFRKATRCEGGACVEVAIGDQILVRNSTSPDQTIAFSKEEWRVFVRAVRDFEFEVD